MDTWESSVPLCTLMAIRKPRFVNRKERIGTNSW
jgi:hypothetical protein